MPDTLKIALIQLTTPADQAAALAQAVPLIERAAAEGAQLILTPECSNLMEIRKDQKGLKVTVAEKDVCVQGYRDLARRLSVPILMGSAIVMENEGELRSSSDSGSATKDHHAVNRTLLIGPDGELIDVYDKVHLFDVELANGESYKESNGITGGTRAVVADVAGVKLGMSICYDVRFAYLFRMLAKAGASVITTPAAFTQPTGKAHWEVLLRARAIETGAFVLAPAQGGLHEDGRKTWGHSLVVGPWGEVIASLDHDRPDVLFATLDLSEVAKARAALPQLKHDRDIVLS
ncbi:carbon-nitrogen hydrolase family protein [Asticcacaulis sp. SL142]|uniref:carbon-nitrogen hydrolase family protein n=1 Tax=Asticcacaulis sp. SL142 TaxID=2995155 RepID=UPI00226CD108|nr:carbon-nitrogen hydrolase family protein [Asticcacaulis sp. SL142]WAC49896.1 carbon-nitrogen hydrolase family protein [Asticcacaulis sp. SL142]